MMFLLEYVFRNDYYWFPVLKEMHLQDPLSMDASLVSNHCYEACLPLPIQHNKHITYMAT